MNDYEKKLEAKRERYLEYADNAEARSGAAYKRSKSLTEGIPFGQPILVGHHSERGHRNALDKSWNAMGKSVAESEKAEYFRNKAASVGKGGISSDDPEAVVKLKEKLAGMVESQELMKAANKVIKKKGLSNEEKISKLEELGIPTPAMLLEPDFAGRIGFASYVLSNNNANMKRVKDRIASLAKAAEAEEIPDKEYDGFKVVRDDNRIQFVFPGKPSAEVRTALKSRAFKWSPTRGAWVREITNNAEYAAEMVVNELKEVA